MDELFDFCKSALANTVGTFCALVLWSYVMERERNRRYNEGLKKAIARAGERMQQPGGVEFIPVEDWPTELEAKDK